MSRVADAYRRSRARHPPQRESEPLIDQEGSLPNELPWELDEPIGLSTDRPASIPLAQVASRRRRSFVDGRSAYREGLVPLIDRILEITPEGSARSLLFMTIDPEPQMASVCATTAEVLAGRTTSTVCVVDASLRSPALQRSFGLVTAPGLSDLLLNGGDVRSCITNVGVNLWVMPAGSRCADALPYLGPKQIRAQLTQLLSVFDYVLLDTAAAGVHNDAIALGACVDGVVLVINANATRREVAKRATETLQGANARLVGAVLTNRSFPIPESIYRRL